MNVIYPDLNKWIIHEEHATFCLALYNSLLYASDQNYLLYMDLGNYCLEVCIGVIAYLFSRTLKRINILLILSIYVFSLCLYIAKILAIGSKLNQIKINSNILINPFAYLFVLNLSTLFFISIVIVLASFQLYNYASINYIYIYIY